MGLQALWLAQWTALYSCIGCRDKVWLYLVLDWESLVNEVVTWEKWRWACSILHTPANELSRNRPFLFFGGVRWPTGTQPMLFGPLGFTYGPWCPKVHRVCCFLRLYQHLSKVGSVVMWAEGKGWAQTEVLERERCKSAWRYWMHS